VKIRAGTRSLQVFVFFLKRPAHQSVNSLSGSYPITGYDFLVIMHAAICITVCAMT
jgi:hypothetical protein